MSNKEFVDMLAWVVEVNRMYAKGLVSLDAALAVNMDYQTKSMEFIATHPGIRVKFFDSCRRVGVM